MIVSLYKLVLDGAPSLSPGDCCFATTCFCYQAEEDRKIVLERRYNKQLQREMHESINTWKEEI